ncbi:tetratricopeptide repeat-containing sulfotransferase family protein [Asticcacaulis solisilvae]|uniref:tetratricopeptide repeat-containing sulfotransferase family protein n=1 Tax=Asticcacaulis solisilvae TaxID=1217274 RepID=UPI003FD7D1B0
MFVSPRLSPAEEAVRQAYAAHREGDLDRARAAALRATGHNPDHLEAWYVLGNIATSANRFDDAVAAFSEGVNRAPEGSPTRGQFMTLRARARIAEGFAADAVADIRAAIDSIAEAPGLVAAATVLSEAGLEAEARPLLERAAGLAPNDAAAWFGLAGARQFFGDLKGAEAAFETSIQCGLRTGNPVPMAWMSLARLRRWTAEDNHIARLEATQCRHSLDAACVAYSLFKEYDDTGNTAAAWDALQHGSMIGGSIDPWSVDEDKALLDGWQAYLPPSRFGTADDRPRPGPRRIFIIGLPRSGTTLVERILVAHSEVQALGELKTFGAAVKILGQTATPRLLDPDTIAAASRLDPLALAEWYTEQTAYLHDGSAFTIDKLPSNHEYAGLIRLAFPDAIIVHVRREPMDSLFGAYKLLFSQAHRWSYSQEHLAQHYDQYRRLMTYWRTCLDASGQPLVEISLEDLIREPEAQIRRLLDLCGMPFEDACLRPHEARGAVATASSAQVRAPINAEGVGAWRRYATELEPLRAQLEAMGYVGADV